MMNKTTSFYLDFLRVFAAVGVLLVHANLPIFSNDMFLNERLGHKLVMLFFVLSGYLIAFTVSKNNKGSQKYLVDRFSRLYSVVFPALALTYFLDFIGSHYNSAYYADQIAPDHQFFRFIVNLTFLPQIWSWCTKPSSNGPFWSISYEFWYYMFFWVYSYFQGTKKYIGLIIICCIVGLKILLLFPVWIFGVLAYKYFGKNLLSNKLAVTLFSITLIVLIILTFFWDFTLFGDRFIPGQAPLYYSSRFPFDWFYGMFVATNLFCLDYITFEIKIPAFLERIVKYLSSITFSLYLFHLPMFIFIGAMVHYDKSSYIQLIPLIILVVLIVGILSNFTEKQRNHWKSLFAKLFHSFDN